MKQQSTVLIGRYRVFQVIAIILGLLITARLFYVQVVRHSFYSARAESAQSKSIELEAARGEIFVEDSGQLIPIVMNQTLKKIIVDPRFIKDAETTAERIVGITKGDRDEYIDVLNRDSAYAVLESEVDLQTANAISALNLRGVAIRDDIQRVYPEGSMLAHVLGFVNADGKGQYGVEQFLDGELAGQPGRVTGTFDAGGIPLAVADNTEVAAEDGRDVVLTIDRKLQAYAEQALTDGLERASAKTGSVVIMDPSNGRIRALANAPTYSPAEYNTTEDISVFQNSVVSKPYEAGSVLKIFTMALGLKTQVVAPSSTYYDTGYRVIDGYTIRNAGTAAGEYHTMTDVIRLSLNTGIIHVFDALDTNTDDISAEDKQKLHTYFTEQLGLGSKTNVELAGEQSGTITTPGESSDVRYANMAFGQGLSVTMMQLAAGLSSIVNGGTYYQPHVVEYTIDQSGKQTMVDPTILRTGVVSDAVSTQLKDMMLEVVNNGGGGFSARKNGYYIGGKTGTAQLANPEGGYFTDRDTGTFYGFIGPQEQADYVIVVRVDEPKVNGYAGSYAAAPIFADIAHWLINYKGIAPGE